MTFLVKNAHINTFYLINILHSPDLTEKVRILFILFILIIITEFKHLYNLIMGFLDNRVDAIDSFGYRNATILCSVVLQMRFEG